MEFAKNSVLLLNLDEEIANTLRTHVHGNVKWSQDYRSAVDSVLNNPDLHNTDLPPPYIGFAVVSRSDDGSVLLIGEQVSAPEIAALVCTHQVNRTVASVQ